MAGQQVTIFLIGEIDWWKNSGEEFKEAIDKAMVSGATELKLYINSEGGDPIQAFEIFNQIKRFKGKKTAMIGALCASSATVVACACDSVYISRFGLFMIHEPSLYAGGMTEEELTAGIGLLQTLKANVTTLYAERTRKTEEEVKSLMKAVTWMTSTQALEGKWVDGIVDEIPDDEEVIYLQPEMTANIPVTMNGNLIPVDIKMKNKLFAALMLAGIQMKADASEDEFVEAVGKILKENGDLKTQLKEAGTATMKAKAKMLVDSAIEQKKIVEGDREEYTQLAEANFELCTKMLGKITPVMQISGNIKKDADGNPVDMSGKKFSERMAADSDGMLKMRAENPTEYKALYKAEYGSDPEL